MPYWDEIGVRSAEVGTAGGAVDRAGSSWAWTGDDLPEWRGRRLGEGFAVQGNRLVGPEPVEAVAEEFERGSGASLDERLLRAIEAGHDAGADRAGERSATLYVMGEEDRCHPQTTAVCTVNPRRGSFSAHPSVLRFASVPRCARHRLGVRQILLYR